MNDFRLFPAARLNRDYPFWVWFAGVLSISGSIIAGSLVLYLISIDFPMPIILFYLLMAVLLPICGHGVLNFRRWAKSLTTVVVGSLILVTISSGVVRLAFASTPSSRGMVDVIVTYGWLMANIYVLIRLLMDRGERSAFNSPTKTVDTESRKGPIYYYAFLILWYGVIFIALMDHMGAVSLPLAGA
ncbi:MAG: hypothetical protein HY788_04890 [Deltaproteobacteria bacterium]|nr:hypothetical protein [Deltaproteobacteria bacterium]